MKRAVQLLVLSLTLLSIGAAVAQEPVRSAPPKLGPPPSLTLPAIERFSLSNGLEVVLLPKSQVPVVQINLLVRSGSVNDPAAKAGLAEMTAEMLDEGAGELSALQLADAIDYLGAELESWSGYHASGLDLFTPLSRIDEALPLLADVARRPSFAESELERQRLDRLTGLLQDRDETRAIVQVQFARTLFGKDHPYGVSVDEASLRAIGVADLKAFHRRHFQPANLVLIVVGAVTRADIEPRLEDAFGSWEAGEKSTASVAEVDQVEGRTVYLVDKPGAAQSEIRIGRIGADRWTDDYFALQVMNTLLGGSFTSRLNSNLREDKGYSYGAGSRFDYRPVAGPFYAASAVQTDVTDKALVEFMKELEGIRTFSDEELGRAKNYLALRYPQRFQTVSSIARQLREVVLFGLPEDYLNRYVGRVLAVTRADVERVARQYVDPRNMAVVVVGDRAKVGDGIKALDLGPIRQLTVEDVLGPAPDLGGGGD